MHKTFTRHSILPGLALLALLAGCREEVVTTHDAPQDRDAPAATTGTAPQESSRRAAAPPSFEGRADAPSGTPAGTAPPASFDPNAPWELPAGWSESPDRPPMRHATLLMPTEDGDAIEVAITRFPGDVGGMLANVNRWRGQVGLPPVGEAELPDLLEPFSTPGFEGAMIHMRGERGDMLVASIHEVAANQTWFVRVIDSPETIDRIKPQVTDFAKTFGRGGAADGSSSD